MASIVGAFGVVVPVNASQTRIIAACPICELLPAMPLLYVENASLAFGHWPLLDHAMLSADEANASV